MSVLLVLLALAALGVCSLREDTPAATTPGRAAAGLRAAGWKRVAWLVTLAVLGVAGLLLFTAVRAGAYGLLLAVAGLCALAASLLAIDRRPVRVRRLEVTA